MGHQLSRRAHQKQQRTPSPPVSPLASCAYGLRSHGSVCVSPPFPPGHTRGICPRLWGAAGSGHSAIGRAVNHASPPCGSSKAPSSVKCGHHTHRGGIRAGSVALSVQAGQAVARWTPTRRRHQLPHLKGCGKRTVCAGRVAPCCPSVTPPLSPLRGVGASEGQALTRNQ